MLGKLTRGQWTCAALLLAVGLLTASWRPLLFSSAVATSDRRPSLLADAEWGKSNEARAFGRRFHAGVLEADLLTWLETNGFRVDRVDRSGQRRLEGVPCAEDINVIWSTEDQRISRADAVVSEGGCL